VLEGDIEACFDNIDHAALLGRVRRRVADKRVLGLVKAFLKAGILGEDGFLRNTSTGTPQGGIVSPLLANIALSVLDDHFAELWQATGATPYQRWKRRQAGLPTYRLVRYADLCRARHKSAYVDRRIMPREGRGPLLMLGDLAGWSA
jgi:RNA-directed DNA polymerase